MLSRGDVFRCSDGQCGFLSRGKKPVSVNNRHSFERPRVHVSYVVASVMAEKLLLPLRCVIETLMTEKGFEYHFKNSIEIQFVQRAPLEIVLRLEEIHSWLDNARDRKKRSMHIDEYVNEDGRLAFAWMFSALFDEEYCTSASEVRATWSTSTARRQPSSPPRRSATG